MSTQQNPSVTVEFVSLEDEPDRVVCKKTYQAGDTDCISNEHGLLSFLPESIAHSGHQHNIGPSILVRYASDRRLIADIPAGTATRLSAFEGTHGLKLKTSLLPTQNEAKHMEGDFYTSMNHAGSYAIKSIGDHHFSVELKIAQWRSQNAEERWEAATLIGCSVAEQLEMRDWPSSISEIAGIIREGGRRTDGDLRSLSSKTPGVKQTEKVDIVSGEAPNGRGKFTLVISSHADHCPRAAPDVIMGIAGPSES